MMIVIDILLVIHVLVSVLIVLVVLMQRPKSEGLGVAFGGGVTDQFLGAQATNVLQKFTRNLGITFFVLTLALSILYSRTMSSGTSKSQISKELSAAPAPKPLAPESGPTTDNSLNLSGTMSPEQAKKLLLEKIDSVVKQSGTAAPSPAPAGNATPAPAASPESDIKGGDMKLQVATPAPDQKKDGQ